MVCPCASRVSQPVELHQQGIAHERIASAAQAMLNKSEEERSGILSTALAFLGLYADPIVARNTSTSDFRIADLMQGDHPMSLYIVVPDSDRLRLKPLTRLCPHRKCAFPSRAATDWRLPCRRTSS
jgi:type IV secretory pathway TraG/TraD family ATPase VirD4